MIKYRNKISLRCIPNAEWRITSDRGDIYDTFKVEDKSTPWTAWWDRNHHSDLREWQKDIGRMFAIKYEDLTPFVIFKKGHGYNQQHDMFLAHSEQHKVWLMMTQDDFWIMPCDFGEFHFDKQDSLGSVLESDIRKVIYEIIDAL
jgi:hypothetical protein